MRRSDTGALKAASFRPTVGFKMWPVNVVDFPSDQSNSSATGKNKFLGKQMLSIYGFGGKAGARALPYA